MKYMGLSPLGKEKRIFLHFLKETNQYKVFCGKILGYYEYTHKREPLIMFLIHFFHEYSLDTIIAWMYDYDNTKYTYFSKHWYDFKKNIHKVRKKEQLK